MIWLSLLAGCITLTVDPKEPVSEVIDCADCDPNTMSGTVMAIVNGKLTDASVSYVSHVTNDDSHVIANSIFLFDPAQPDVFVKLGNVDLGPDELDDQAKSRQSIRELAWHPEHGLWGLSIDSVNDEWQLVQIDVPDWNGTDQLLPGTTYAFRTADPIYWEPSVVGMGFVGDTLYIGTRAWTSGAPGTLFASELPTGWSVDPAYPEDPVYYSDKVLTSVVGPFPEGFGLAGDIQDGFDSQFVLRTERQEDGALDGNWLWTEDSPRPSSPDFTVLRDHDVEGLAGIDGVIIGVDTDGGLRAADPEGEVILADVADRFVDPLYGIRLRGAATVDLDSK